METSQLSFGDTQPQAPQAVTTEQESRLYGLAHGLRQVMPVLRAVYGGDLPGENRQTPQKPGEERITTSPEKELLAAAPRLLHKNIRPTIISQTYLYRKSKP